MKRLASIALAAVLLGAMAPVTAQQGPGSLGFPDLVSGLKATPGCLGVETARTSGGKNVIFAWFENKDAVLKWYYSDMHQGAMKMFPGDRRKPLTLVDGDGPILAIASVTVADKPMPGTNIPISQIAIELYRPLPGGIALGGRFAPSSLKVQGLVDVPMPKGGGQ